MENRGLKIVDAAESAKPLRLFVAISLPEAVKDEIEKVQKEMRSALPGDFIRWTKREQFHLTLKFLGNVAASRVAELTKVLREAGRHFATLRLRAERIGFFPDERFPRVAWVGVQDDKDVLSRLQQAIEIKVKDFAAEKDVEPAGRRRSQGTFTGHITLARIQGIKRAQAEIFSKLALGMAGRFFGEWTADKVELIRSELSPGGSRYTTVATVSLSYTS
jgi:2'-5' RNA ligase